MSDPVWTSLSEVTPEPVRWLWDGRIPLGKVTLLDGEPGVGKSTLALELAARVTNGSAMPLVKGPAMGPADVVVFSGDDSLADTVLPRLKAAGANLARIRPVDREIGVKEINDLKPALIVLDPLSSYICLSCDQSPRQVMRTLNQLARGTGAAVLAVQYLPDKAASDLASEIFGTVRTALLLSAIGQGMRRLVVSKSILRPIQDVHTLVYHHEDKGGVARILGWADSV
jgi:hypothetical protein